ncbi:peptide-methionine (S)-S-oxide reductase MsrA [Candidatus Woesearchaeota archaeon]|nr:peptide-methionine (S)-S-oxide reductase MsrA [Candidatus Woesearchaeota archaeon]
MEKATFAAGCFWGVEYNFYNLKGVVKTTVGYTGGHTKNPTYKDVCSDETGHAEAVEVEFDPKLVKYEGLLDVFWKSHNPTTANRQGPDVGSQYRSAIFYHNSEQKEKAIDSRKKEQKKHKEKIVTEITKASAFYPAEEYHQKYFLKNKGFVCH